MSRLDQQPDRQEPQPPARRDPNRRSASWWISALWLLAGAVLIWMVLVAVGHLLGHQWKNSGLVHWDASVDRNLANHRHQPWIDITHLTTYLAETETVIAIGLVAFLLLRLGLKRWREPLFLAVSLIGEVTIFVSTTLLVDRNRPPVKHLDGAPPTSSFPSGHTAASVALYGGLAVIAWRVGAAVWLRTLATVAAVVVPVVVAVSRMYRGMHYPTDVIAGALLACCWLAVTSTVILGRRTPP
jgi:membrane-associated phospholipid phosphatase